MMKINRRMILGVLLAGALLLAGVLLRDFLLVNFVHPMALMLWIGNRLIASIDQAAYWAGLILLITFLSLLRLSRQPAIRETQHTRNGSATLNSLSHWRTLILITTDEMDRVNFLKHSLRTLLKDVYASKEPSQVPWKIYQGFEQGNIAIPAWMREFLDLDQSPKPNPSLEHRLRYLAGAPGRWLRHWQKQDLSDYYQNIADVISFMEKELENEDEH